MEKLLSFLLISFCIAFDYYVEAICTAKLDSNKTSKWGSVVSFLAAFGLGLLWNDHHIGAFIFPFSKDAFDEHGMSGSVVLAVLFLSIGKEVCEGSCNRSNRLTLITKQVALHPCVQ